MRFYAPSATGAPATVAAPARPRSPIGRWFATPADLDVDPGTLALARHLAAVGIDAPTTRALGIRVRLVALMIRDRANDDGAVTRYTAPDLAFVIEWPDAAGDVHAVLEHVGITKDGRMPNWHVISGTRSPDERRRMQTRDRVRRFRERQRLAQSDPTASPDSVTPRYPVTQSAAAYIEVRARACAGTGTSTHTATALRAETTPRADISDKPTESATLPEAVVILADIWPGPCPPALRGASFTKSTTSNDGGALSRRGNRPHGTSALEPSARCFTGTGRMQTANARNLHCRHLALEYVPTNLHCRPYPLR